VKLLWRSTALYAVLATVPAIAGEIPGLPPQLPPWHEGDFALTFSNDFLGRGGSVDDFRTQQIIASTKLSDKWLAVFDHSILTLDNGTEAGRVDQLSASLGYKFVDSNRGHGSDSVVMGFGIRSAGSFAGERMQNGFHRLIGSTVEQIPYVTESATDVTAWFDANHYRLLRERGEAGLLPGWQRGYWLRAGSMLTTAGQWDNTALAAVVASRPSADLWLGVRGDWRSGYDDMVLRETAQAEDDVAIVLGVRYGALVIETVQQLNNDASYGQLRLVSTGRRNAAVADREIRIGFDFGLTLPDVQMRIAGKYRSRMLVSGRSRWRESVLVAASYGEPQHEDDNTLFVRSGQLDVGLEFERPWLEGRDWLRAYVATTAGWREQSLITVNDLQDQRSQSAGRAVLTVGTGIRVDAAGSGSGWWLRIQAGVIGTLPLSDALLELDGEPYRVQKPALNLLIGFVLDFN